MYNIKCINTCYSSYIYSGFTSYYETLWLTPSHNIDISISLHGVKIIKFHIFQLCIVALLNEGFLEVYKAPSYKHHLAKHRLQI